MNNIRLNKYIFEDVYDEIFEVITLTSEVVAENELEARTMLIDYYTYKLGGYDSNIDLFTNIPLKSIEFDVIGYPKCILDDGLPNKRVEKDEIEELINKNNENIKVMQTHVKNIENILDDWLNKLDERDKRDRKKHIDMELL